MTATTQERQSVSERVFADPVHASPSEIKAAARELERGFAGAVARLKALQAGYAERSLELLTKGDLEGARKLALDIEEARSDAELRRAAIDGASTKLERAARESEEEAEKTQWEKVIALMRQRSAVVIELAQCARRAGELYRTAYGMAEELWSVCPRKPTSNRGFLPFMDPDNMRNEFELYFNQVTGGLYPGLGEFVPAADLVGACQIGHAQMLAMRPVFGMPARFVVKAEDFTTLGHQEGKRKQGDRIGTGAVLGKEGFEMPGSHRAAGLRFEIAEVDWDAVNKDPT